MYQLFIEDHFLKMAVGVYPQEQGCQQTLSVSMILTLPADVYPREGDENFPCYHACYKTLEQYAKSRSQVQLLETVAMEIVDLFHQKRIFRSIFVKLYKVDILKNVHKIGIQLFKDFS